MNESDIHTRIDAIEAACAVDRVSTANRLGFIEGTQATLRWAIGVGFSMTAIVLTLISIGITVWAVWKG